MTLLLRTVVTVSVLLVSTTATPPTGYVKQPDNDKNPPSYRYNYEIQDESGTGQAKTEARDGEHASGRYYVNSKQASTDVKYYADDWGYHPFVKYSSADDHSSSSASLAFGEQAVKSYNAANETPSPTNLPRSRETTKLVPVTQPYHQSQQSIVYSSDASNSNHPSSPAFSSSSSSSSVSSQQSESNSVNVNYVTSLPTQPIIETVSSSSANNGEAFLSTGRHQLTQQHYHQQQSNHLGSQENDLSSSSASDEDQLIEENAGSFGARVRGDASYQAATSNALSGGDTRDGRYYQHHGRLHLKNARLPTSYLPSVLPGRSYFTSTPLPPLDNGVTANSIESSNEAPNHRYEFSKPIVVAEPEHKDPPFQYSTTFECEDDKSPAATTPYPLLYRDDAASSSHVLNSIQAGVALVNAGEAHLIGQAAETARLPAPVEEKIDEFADQPAQLTNTVAVQRQGQNYVGINPAFDGQDNTQQPQALTQSQQQQHQQQQQQQDTVVEIQKSIEIYHSSPQHEIHYPGTLPTQVAQIDQQQQAQYFIGGSAADDENTKQQSSQSRGDTNYEITGTYSKVAGGNEPVYIVPPATYILDNNSLQKNTLQNDKTQQYQQENSQLIKLNEQQNDNYHTEIDHQDQLHTVTPKQERYEEESFYVTQPVEKIIEKKIPYPVEKVVEKKVPIPYPIPIEIPVPQPYPIHIEKVIEKKIPIPVHIPIPQPYPVEKPIHIPVPVAKIVENKVPYPVEIPKFNEKPLTSQAPHYGQHYGVSYQQIMKPQNHGLYSHQAPNQYFQRYVYEKPLIQSANVKPNLEQNPFLKKHTYNSYLPAKANSLLHRRHAAVQRPSDFLGPPPLQRQPQQQQQHTFQPKKSFVSHPTSSSRRARNHDPPKYHKGNFRQSKIEYGFKPPMVPSVQYDEESASKVES